MKYPLEEIEVSKREKDGQGASEEVSSEGSQE